jgi:hypothetical protein
LPALAVPAVAVAAAAKPDPIYAAIDRWKELDVVWGAALKAYARAEEGDDEGTVKLACEAEHEAGDAVSTVIETIFAMVPTTLAGMHAKIDWAFNSIDYVSDRLLNTNEEDAHIPQQFMLTLYEAARLMVVRS